MFRPIRPISGCRLGAALTAALLAFGCSERAPSRHVFAPIPEVVERMSTPVRWSLDAFLDACAALEVHSGSVAVFAHQGEVVYAKASGYADVAQEKAMALDTRFRIASMTKPITAVAALRLIEEGHLALDDRVDAYLPAAGSLRVATSTSGDGTGAVPSAALEDPLTVRHLLTFTSGIGSEEDPSDLGLLWRDRNIYTGEGTLADRVDRMLTAPLYEEPGRIWRYGWSADVLARVMEVATGESFEAILQSRVFDPLDMRSTGFEVPEAVRHELATMYTQDAEGELVLVPSPRSVPVDWTPGGGGLVSTARDYLRFALMLWNGGSYDGVRVLSPESVERMTQPHVTQGVLDEFEIGGMAWGLGLAVVHDSEETPMVDHTGDFWWTGFYGTHFFVSPETDVVGVVLTQNQPSPYSSLPYPIHIAPALALFGI